MAAVVAMGSKEARPTMDTSRCLFIDGYLTELFESGHEPTYGYPKNHLPETDGSDMEIHTGFLASRASSK